MGLPWGDVSFSAKARPKMWTGNEKLLVFLPQWLMRKVPSWELS